MRPDDPAAVPDRDDLDSTPHVSTRTPPAPAADPIEAAVGADPVADVDEDLIDDDCSKPTSTTWRRSTTTTSTSSTSSSSTPTTTRTTTTIELTLLHELGIDLDAPDAEPSRPGVGPRRRRVDDEVAATTRSRRRELRSRAPAGSAGLLQPSRSGPVATGPAALRRGFVVAPLGPGSGQSGPISAGPSHASSRRSPSSVETRGA